MYGFEHCPASAPTAPSPRVAGTSSGPAMPSCSAFPFFPCASWCLLDLLGLFLLCLTALGKRMGKMRTSFFVTLLSWDREPEIISLPVEERLSLCSSWEHTDCCRGTSEEGGSFLPCSDASQGSMLYSHNSVRFHP